MLRVGDVTLTEREDAQTLREKLARIVLDEMYQFVGLLDAEGRTLEINRTALDGAGVRLQDIRGRPFWEARWFQVSREVTDAQREYVRRAGDGEFIRCDMEVYGQSAGEQTIVVDFSLLPVKDEQGRVVFLLAEGRNITEKKRAEAEVARKNAELEALVDRIRQLDRLKSDLFANVSHELRTPLALILGPTEELLATGRNLSEGQRRHLEVVHRNAATLLKHVNDLLDLARLDARKVTLRYARVDLAQRLRSVAEQFHALAPQRSIAYVVDAPERLMAEVDAEKFERVLLNLLSNAFKFTPSGGRIRCVLEPGERGRALIVVQDSGPGIAPELQEAIFERFRQIQTGTTRDFGGTGLGLAIAKEFVDLHGGTIAVGAAPGGGALFQVEIPLLAPQGEPVADAEAAGTAPAVAIEGALAELGAPADDGDAAAAMAVDQARPRPPASTVLVVEDNAEMRRFVSDALAAEHRVIAVCDGEQALTQLRLRPPDLVVTDLMLPRLGGDRLVEQMRHEAASADVPVLVLSAKDDEVLRTRLLAGLVQDYVTKPFSASELRARVRNLTTMKIARDALRRELASHNDDLAQLTHDLIESRRALQGSEQRWAAMYEHSPVGIVLADEDGLIRAANPAFRVMLGYADDELRRTNLLRVTPVEDRAGVRSRIAQLLAGEVREHHQPMRFQRQDQRLVWANASLSCVPGDAAGPRHLIVVAENVTERRQAEEALGRARAELARVTRVSTLGELAASIAHELNQPLAAIVANGQACVRWLDAEPSDDAEVRAAVQRMTREANRASEVIGRIRRFLTRGELQREALDLPRAIEEVLVLVKKEAQNSRVWLEFEPAGTLPTITADRVQIQQVVLNLVMNALEAINALKSGGRWLRVLATDTSEAIRIDVRDSGIGIEPEDLDRVLDAFHTTKPGGMGMGLAISRSIVEAHGGRIWVSRNDGPGVTVSFTLPHDAH